MPTEGVLSQPQTTDLMKAANDGESSITFVESDDGTDDTGIESDNQSSEDGSWEDEGDSEGNEEHATRGNNRDAIEGSIAFKDDLFRDPIKQPKMLQTKLSEADLERLDAMMRLYEKGIKGANAEQNGWNKPLYSISVMALLAEKEGIWGPFVVVALDSSLPMWQQEFSKIVPSFKVLPYWGTDTSRNVLRNSWDRKQPIYTQESPFHVLITSYQLAFSDAAYFQTMQWQFIVLDDTAALKSTSISKIKDVLGFYRFPGPLGEPLGSQTDQADIAQNVGQPSDTGIVRKRSVLSSRRSHGRVDGLEHLCEFTAGAHGLNAELIRFLVVAPPAVEQNETEMEALHGIAFCLVRLNISILEARDHAHQNNDYNLFSDLESSHMDDLITADEYKKWYPTPGIPMDSAQETRLAEYTNTFPREQIIQRIRDPKALPYISKLFERRLMMYETWKVQRKMFENNSDFVVPTLHRERGKGDYTYTCVSECRLWRQSLRDLYNITLQLRNDAIAACSSNLLDDISLRQLKAKITALQLGFQEICDELGLPREKLVWDSQTWWLDPHNTELNHQFLDSQPKTIVTAFPATSNSNTKAALTFLVPVLSFLSCIPAALAWTQSAHQPGTTSDADFFQLISNTAMQLLGNMTLIIPTVSNARLVGQAWLWTWVLAGTSTVCAIMAIPLYLNAPTEWSGTVSFAGNVMQAFVALQLMFAI